MRRALFVLTAIALAAGLAACGERDQVVVYKQGKYQGKPDAPPWNSEAPAAELRGGKWSKGDRASWETAINTRAAAQNEYKRIYQQ